MTNSSRVRIIELALVLSIAFAGYIMVSLYTVSRGPLEYDSGQSFFNLLHSLVQELLAIALLAYVLFRQGRSIHDLGLTFSWRDIPRSVLLMLVVQVTYYSWYLAIYYGNYLATGRTMTLSKDPHPVIDMGVTGTTLLFLVVNAFYEELIVRAYTMSELKFLTGSQPIAIAGSVLLQLLYHLYQGVGVAIAGSAGFFVFSLYYGKRRCITPIILAHLYIDMVALVLRW